MTDDEEEDALIDQEENNAEARQWLPDLHWLTDQLALGARFPIERVPQLAEAYAIRAIVDLRAEDCDDEAILREAGIELLHLPTPDLEPATHAHLDKGVAFVRERLNRGDRVLIHCQHGIGRSALLALCVLVDHGWDPLDALRHAKDRRWVVSPSRMQYDGWVEWLRSRGIAPPDYHSFGCIAYRHLAKS